MLLLKKNWFLKRMHHLSIISKINGVKIDHAEDLDVVMPMYNLLESGKNYKKNKKNQVAYGIIIEINQVVL